MSSSTSVPPCPDNEVTASSGGCASSDVEKFIEKDLWGFRVWQWGGIILSVLLSIMIALCCCIRFRIPRTKQEIEADYIRKKITRSFGKELTKIKNEEMEEMDLRRALERVKSEFDAETELRKQQGETTSCEPQPPGFRTRFNAILHGVHMHMARNKPSELDGVI